MTLDRSGLPDHPAVPGPISCQPDEALSTLELLRQPVWVFDIDRKRVHWANSAALAVWRARSLTELRARDMASDMSPSVAARLKQYQADFLEHDAVFNEQWTLYPGGHPVSLNLTYSGYRLPDGRMALFCEGRSVSKEQPEAVRSVEALLHTPVMISLYDVSGSPLYRNPAARASVRSYGDLLSERIVDPCKLERLIESIGTGGTATMTLRSRTANGLRWHDVSARRCLDAATGQTALLISEVDVTPLKESEARASYLARHDPLTGLPNRNEVREAFGVAVGRLGDSGQQAALILIDLDHFKDVNDTLGHAVGDRLLVEIAERLRASTRRDDLAARFGGDEFLLLVVADDIRSEVQRIDDRVRAAVSMPMMVGRNEVMITATLGVSVYPDDGIDFETLLRHADLAMYAAKDRGRNAVAFYDRRMGERLEARTALEAELRRALLNHEFEVWYQPRVDVATEQVVAAEALVRWRHPVRGLVMPGEFIGLCETAGLIRDLGRLVFAEAARQQARWRADGFDLVVSVNLSSREFGHSDLVQEMAQALRASGCRPEAMQVEITESMLIGSDQQSLAILQAIEGLGMSIALDDFGTGYSNLGYLQRFPIRTLKIDRSFIQGAGMNRALAELVFELCRQMGLESVAEGVETQEQLDWIRSRGVKQFQGYLVARAMPVARFDDWMRAWPSVRADQPQGQPMLADAGVAHASAAQHQGAQAAGARRRSAAKSNETLRP